MPGNDEARRLNMNEAVLIKIKQRGHEIMRERHEALRREFPTVGPYRPPDVDANGYTRMQLWCVMQEFGPHITMGFEPPFETEILIPVTALATPPAGA